MEHDQNTIVRLLGRIPLFLGLEPAELKVVHSLCKPTDCRQGDTLFNEGDPSHNMYILLSGEIYIVTERNGIVATLTPCDIFGEMGLITQRTRSASAIARTDCRLLRIDHLEFNLLAGRAPRISSVLMRNISANLANHVVRMNNAPPDPVGIKSDEPPSPVSESQVLRDEHK